MLRVRPEFVFFDFGPDSATKFRANKSVKKIPTKKNGEGVLVGLDDQGECGNDEKETGDGALRAPIESLEAGITNLAEHHKAEEEEKSC